MFPRKIGTFLTALQRSMANMFVLRHLHTGGQNFLITEIITLLFCLHWLMLVKDSFLTAEVGQYGRVSDENVFANSNIAMRLARQNIGLPPDENLGGVHLPYIVIHRQDGGSSIQLCQSL
jgi:hypothetical protein